MSDYIIKDDDVREYFHQEYSKINVRVVPGHWPDFKTIKEVDRWIQHMKKLEDSFDDIFKERKIEDIFILKGNSSLLDSKDKLVGLIGSRKATKEELRTAYVVAQKLVKKGYTVVSGMAEGVDTESHKATIDSNGKTIAILSTCPSEPIYPNSNKELFHNIVKKGLIVFPYKEAAKWEKGFSQPQKRLIERDILLAYICSRIIVVSDKELITGGSAWALNYGEKLKKSIWRVDTNFKYHSKPNYEKK